MTNPPTPPAAAEEPVIVFEIEGTRYRRLDVHDWEYDVGAGWGACSASDALVLEHSAGLAARVAELEQWQREREDAEAACCPEDVGFAEYIAVLTRRVASVERERDAAWAANERDRTGFAYSVESLRRFMHRWGWIEESRGPYEWDDDEYQAEFGRCMAELRKIVARMERKTHAFDRSDCPTTQSGVDAALAAAPDHSVGVTKMVEPTVRTCVWEYDESDCTWSTSCGRLWQFIDDGPTENRMDYCHGCGKRVRAVEDMDIPAQGGHGDGE